MDDDADDGPNDMDAITGAKAVGALTKVADGAASKAGSVATDVVRALVMPTAHAYGSHWAAQTKARLAEAAKAKKQDNIRAHLEGVRGTLGDDFKPDPALTQQWIDGVENIDPVDEELSAAWRAVLLAIGSGEAHRQRLLDVVKTLTPDEATAFMHVAESHAWPRRDATNEYRRRFESLKLVVRPLDRVMNSSTYLLGVTLFIVIGMSIAGAILAPAVIPPFRDEGPTYQSRDVGIAQATAWLLVFAFGAAALMQVRLIFSRPELTELGRALWGLSRRAMEAGRAKSAQEAAPKAEQPARRRKPRTTASPAPSPTGSEPAAPAV